jgi:ABC-2 type transport system ATP-binding protein
VEILDVGLRRPTLDDVFLQLTGHHAEADGPPGTGPAPPDGATGSATAATAGGPSSDSQREAH